MEIWREIKGGKAIFRVVVWAVWSWCGHCHPFLSSPVDSGTAQSIIQRHATFSSVINDLHSRTLTHTSTLTLMKCHLFSHPSFPFLWLQILRRADKNGMYLDVKRMHAVIHRVSIWKIILLCDETDILNEWNSNHESLLIRFPWKQETDPFTVTVLFQSTNDEKHEKLHRLQRLLSWQSLRQTILERKE